MAGVPLVSSRAPAPAFEFASFEAALPSLGPAKEPGRNEVRIAWWPFYSSSFSCSAGPLHIVELSSTRCCRIRKWSFSFSRWSR